MKDSVSVKVVSKLMRHDAVLKKQVNYQNKFEVKGQYFEF